MVTKEFINNRARFPVEALKEYADSWVAFAKDGKSIVAGAETLHLLEDRLQQLAIDPQETYFEFVPGSAGDVFVSPESPGWNSRIKARS